MNIVDKGVHLYHLTCFESIERARLLQYANLELLEAVCQRAWNLFI